MGALAYAQGSGLPLTGDIWPTMAEALRGERYDEKDVSWLCSSAARFLLQREEEGEVTYLRLFHGALAGCLKLEGEDAAVHRRIAASLADLISLGTRCWLARAPGRCWRPGRRRLIASRRGDSKPMSPARRWLASPSRWSYAACSTRDI
jgi:hypothetical protein